jgi:glycosyltransferase involved in cell wall biosynthesis
MKLSIITVSYNSENFIEKCITSVISQSYKNIEYIVIDNLSTDNTSKILQKYSNNISLIVQERDKGVYDAMNKGIKFAKGDVVGFLNSDDFYADKEVLSKVANKFNENPSLGACYSDLIYIDKINSSKIIRYWESNQFVPGSFSKGWCPPHPTFFVRRLVYKYFGGFNLNYRTASDVELMMRFLEINKICSEYVPEIWVNMRIGGLSNRSLKSIICQNQDVRRALANHGLNNNFILFFTCKIISRIKQLIRRKNI